MTEPRDHADEPSDRYAEPTSGPPSEAREALIATLVELEHHVGADGWDQPARLFALVLSAELGRAEPALVADLGLADAPEGALTAVEQDDFDPTGDLLGDLERIEFPATVFGCAISTERTFLPRAYEADLPEDPAAAAAAVAAHPERQEIRVVVGVTRSGDRHGVARLVSAPTELLAADDLVPGLSEALAHTLS